MQNEELVVIAVFVVISVLGTAAIAAAVLATDSRRRRFTEFANGRRLAMQALGAPWRDPVAIGNIQGAQIAIGPVLDFDGIIRFRTKTARALPRGLYVHSQTFVYNTGGQRPPGAPRYDGSGDEPGVSALTSHVPEIVLGDPEMDRAFVIQGDDEPAVRALLSRPEVREHMLRVVSDGTYLRVREASVELDVEMQDLTSLETYDGHVAWLLALARTLDAAS